jgi:hypothetical protein
VGTKGWIRERYWRHRHQNGKSCQANKTRLRLTKQQLPQYATHVYV